MTPEEKAEVYIKDLSLDESDRDVDYLRSEIKQAYLAGYAQRDKEIAGVQINSVYYDEFAPRAKGDNGNRVRGNKS